MHMIAGLLLASFLRKKTCRKARLPSIHGKLEVVHTLPGRLRLGSSLLEHIPEETRKKISAALLEVPGIELADINTRSGSLLIHYNPASIHHFVVHGIVVKLLGLEKAFETSPEGRLIKEFRLIGQALNQQIFQSSGGWLDFRSALMFSILMLAVHQIVIRGNRTLPSGVNLLWWTYILVKKGK